MHPIRYIVFGFVAAVFALSVQSAPCEGGNCNNNKGKLSFWQTLGYVAAGTALYVGSMYAVAGVPVGGENGEDFEYQPLREYIAQKGGLSGIMNELSSTFKYNIDSATQALSGVNVQNMARSLNLPDPLVQASANVDLGSLLTKLLCGVAAGGVAGGALNLASGSVFLTKLADAVPSLRGATDGMKLLMSTFTGGTPQGPADLVNRAIAANPNAGPGMANVLSRAAPAAMKMLGGDKSAALDLVGAFVGNNQAQATSTLSSSLINDVISQVQQTAQDMRHAQQLLPRH